MRRAARRVAGHGARARPRHRGRPGRAGLRARRVRQLRPQPARRSSSATASRPGATSQSLADRAGLVKMSDEDVELLHPGADPADIARSLLGGDRTELVVVTHGASRGGGVHRRARRRGSTPRTVDTVDTVGAGDSFMSALLAILLDDGALGAYGAGMPRRRGGPDRLIGGAAQAAAITCSRRGANPPTRAELPRRLARWFARLSRCACRAASTSSNTTGSNAMPQWLVRTSTCSRERVEAAAPVDDAVAAGVDRGVADVGCERRLGLLPAVAGALARRRSPRSSCRRGRPG